MPEFGSYPEKESPAAGDFLLVLDGDDDATKKVDVGNLPSGGGPVESVFLDATSDETLLFEQGSSEISGTVTFSAWLDPTPHIQRVQGASSCAVTYRLFLPQVYFTFTEVLNPESGVYCQLDGQCLSFLSDLLTDALGSYPTIPGFSVQPSFTVRDWQYDSDFNWWYLFPAGQPGVKAIFNGTYLWSGDHEYLSDPLEEGGSLDWYRSYASVSVDYVEDL